MFTIYYEQDGLAGNAVSCILEDTRGDLWMSTNKGLSDFNPETKTFKNYSTADGLPGDDLTGWGACFQSPTGEMFFGGYGGATAFSPNQVSDKTYVPPVVLTDFRLKGSPVEVGDRSPLKVSITEARDLTFSHDQNMFSFEFAALSFLSPQTNRYRYKLEGLDSEWHQARSERRIVTYTTLPTGAYVFRVQGATSRGPWSEPGTALRIEILPPWWATWWFRTTCAILIVLILLVAYSYRLHQIARQFELRLEERVNERTRIARELHDTLLQSFNALLLRFQTAADLLSTRPDEARRTLDSTIDQTAQALIEGRDAVQQLRPTGLATSDLVCAIGSLGQALAAGLNGDAPAFHVEVEGTPRDLLPIARDEVYRIAGEALRNAFQHAQARQVEVEIRYDRQQLRLRIRDDGRGIDPQFLRSDGLSKHYGLRGMQERAQLLAGTLTIWSKPNSGTEIDLTVPSSGAYAKLGLSGFRILARRR
jgi:signal transduction histidine kinase